MCAFIPTHLQTHVTAEGKDKILQTLKEESGF